MSSSPDHGDPGGIAKLPALHDPNAETINSLLDDESHTSLDTRLDGDFLDRIHVNVENPIRQ
jgi:hypothetical protein